ncbi:hypothetical protein ACUOFC_27355, partial [Escherichia sp. TWPC-MK]
MFCIISWTLLPDYAAYRGDWDQKNNRIVLELPPTRDGKNTSKQVSELSYAFAKKAYNIAKTYGGPAEIAAHVFDDIVTNNLSLESLQSTVLKLTGIDISKDLGFTTPNEQLRNQNYFGALGSLYFTHPEELYKSYPDL